MLYSTGDAKKWKNVMKCSVIKLIKYIMPAFLIVLIMGGLWCGYHICADEKLTTTYYTVQADIAAPICIVQLSDLHNAVFGENNSELVRMVTEQQPDLIVMTGDMLNRDEERTDVVCNLIASLKEIAPVYFGYGNHETDWEKKYNRELTAVFSAAGANVVDLSYSDMEINGNPVRLGGYMAYYRQPGMLQVDEEQKQQELAFADSFENTDRLKILLNHIPTQWVNWGYIDDFPVDLVFSGHYHGGAIQLPLIHRGLYCPYVGLFPKNTKGVFKGTRSTCILSAGLGSEHRIPRINNPAEVVVVDVVPDESGHTGG